MPFKRKAGVKQIGAQAPERIRKLIPKHDNKSARIMTGLIFGALALKEITVQDVEKMRDADDLTPETISLLKLGGVLK